MSIDKDLQVERAVDDLRNLTRNSLTTAKIIKIDKFGGEFSEFPENLSEEIVEIFKKKGIEKLFSHQSSAIGEILTGNNVVVSTPTASGKTLIYNSVTLDSLIRDKNSKSLYLFPTKALAQDQLHELFELNKLLGDRLGLFTYDGDTPSSVRVSARDSGRIIISNPDMLHSGILPNHPKWIKFLSLV